MNPDNSRRATVRLRTAITIFSLACAGGAASAGTALAGSGGIGEAPPPTTPTDPTTPAPTAPTTTTTADAVFPLPAKHSYGDGIGAGRDHQGQDLMSKCGKRIVSLWTGRVQKVDTHPAAGNYVVIDGSRQLQDTIYMHMRTPSKLTEGTKVLAGQTIGRVGQTGNASACHLHFELWSNPGYYEGGSAVDPTPLLESLDKKKYVNR